MAKLTLLIASDHAGVELKASLQKLLPDYDWRDLGPMTKDRVDYPDFAEKLSKEIQKNTASQGVLICGTGIGVAIAANKLHGIRAATVENPVSARLACEHNDANVLCLGARILAPEYAAEIVEAWLHAKFANGRHTGRVEKIRKIEDANE